MSVSPNPLTLTAVTLDNCASEPIRVPGSIQRHGFLLTLDETMSRVAIASENAEEFLKKPFKLILGAPLEALFDREVVSAIRLQNCSADPEGMITYLGTFQVNGDLFSCLTHCMGGIRIVEFEVQDRLVGSEMMNSVITNFVATLSRLETPQDLCEAVTKQVAQLTGFDRVLLYSFDVEGHGTVLSEANNGRLPSYLDLRFPATDIPQQARDLYVLNTVRIIPNAVYEPSPIRSEKPLQPSGFDMSLCVLRSVSPVHLEYMRNMGTQSSMSISIVSEGRLWGLISAHHAEPRMVPYLVRSACDMLTKLVGTQLTTFRASSRVATLTHFHGVQRQVLTHIAAESDYLAGLSSQMNAVLEITSAESVALWVDGECQKVGNPPPVLDIGRIVHWLDTLPDDVYVTRQLSADLPWTADLADSASGMLAIRISDVNQRYILWFRPQVIRTVTWAGEPIKEKDAANQLHPRKSFESWRETFRGQSLRWSEVELESAREFRAAVTTISLRRAEEEAEVSNARFEQLTHALPEKVFTADDEGRLSYTNERWTEQDLPTTGIWYGEGRMSPEDEARIAVCWTEAVRTGGKFEEEVRMLTGPDRIPRWNLIRVVPFRRKGAARAGWVGSVIDLTDQREREAAVRRTEKLALTGRMTSVIAHEINNPLESITNLLYLVRSDLPAGADALQYITQAESELERISGITKQTLRWSRENSMSAESFEAGAMFQDVLRLFRGKIRNRNVTATVRFGDDVQVRGILGQVRQVVANLVANAVDAARLGGNVWMSASRIAEGVQIEVGDDGVGMSPETLRQLFQPFFSTKGDLGNGLGLYIAHEIVDRHSGTLTVESVLEKGSIFRMYLPDQPKNPPTASGEHDDFMG